VEKLLKGITLKSVRVRRAALRTVEPVRFAKRSKCFCADVYVSFMKLKVKKLLENIN
jgi:hypothetical protein